MTDYGFQTITQTAEQIAAGDLSPVELTQAMLDRIDAHDGRFGSYVTVLAESALADARAAEQEIGDGNYRGPLHGIPLAIKDLLFTEGIPTSCGSEMMREWIPDQDAGSPYAPSATMPATATVVHKLRDAGAIILGKLHMTEYAMRWHHPYRPIPLNPWGEGLWSGVSSSGSGVAPAAGLCFGALGTDTGGSIRFPAACCGIVGLKQTYGRVSRAGVFPLAGSLDNVGPLTRSVADAAVMLGAIAGHDPLDPVTSTRPVPNYLAAILDNAEDGVKGIRIGVDEGYISNDVHAGVSGAVKKAVGVLEDLGAQIVSVQMPDMAEVEEAWYTICSIEAAVAHRGIYPDRADEYGPFLQWVQRGAAHSGEEYARAHAIRDAIAAQLLVIFEQCDVIACPLLPTATPRMDEAGLPILPPGAASSRFFSYPYSLSRNPSLVLPCGFDDAQAEYAAVPITLQLVARHWEEALLCRVGHAFEQATEWHKKRPTLAP